MSVENSERSDEALTNLINSAHDAIVHKQLRDAVAEYDAKRSASQKVFSETMMVHDQWLVNTILRLVSNPFREFDETSGPDDYDGG